MPIFLLRRQFLRALLLGALLLVTGAAGCQEPKAPPESDFQRAEALLRVGDYDGATQLYESFLTRHPHSPLAPIARQRLANIDRELEAVMGRRATPAPIYIRPQVSDDDGGGR